MNSQILKQLTFKLHPLNLANGQTESRSSDLKSLTDTRKSLGVSTDAKEQISTN